jgi:hypothetical protein
LWITLWTAAMARTSLDASFDQQGAGIPEELLDAVFMGESIAAEDLNRFRGHFEGGLTTENHAKHGVFLRGGGGVLVMCGDYALDFNFDSEYPRLMGEPNIHLKGVALRLKALEDMATGDAPYETIETALSQSEDLAEKQMQESVAIVPAVTGRAHIIGFHGFVVNIEDPFKFGLWTTALDRFRM